MNPRRAVVAAVEPLIHSGASGVDKVGAGQVIVVVERRILRLHRPDGVVNDGAGEGAFQVGSIGKNYAAQVDFACAFGGGHDIGFP